MSALTISTEVLCAMIGAVTAVVLEVVRVAGDRHVRRSGRRRTRHGDQEQGNGL